MTLKQIAKTNGKNYNSYMQFISHSVSDTMLFAESIADKCKGNEIIILNGDLGSGKTTFTKGFAKALGITTDVTSPTFTLMKSYKGERLDLYHFDLYRVENIDDIEELGFDEYFDCGGVCVIEWNKFKFSSEKIIIINFYYINDTDRKLIAEGLDESFSC